MNLTGAQKKTVLASFLGWTLDAFDFFLLTFLLKDIAKEFGVGVPAGRLRPVPDAGDALRRRLHLRPDRRQMGPQAGADARHRLLFRDRRGRRLRAEPGDLPGAARAVRRRDGRRMGPWQFAGDGIDPAAGARLRLGPAAMRLSHRLPARLGRLWPARMGATSATTRRLARAVPAVSVLPALVVLFIRAHRAGIAGLRGRAEGRQAEPLGIDRGQLGAGRSIRSC